ncbi:MAG: hypothetical protein PHO32_10295, partial [Candidatus Cloacimonetes bacterium]|nr:hypothetical protein [Candidatus Cloacimonadota bacterium]
ISLPRSVALPSGFDLGFGVLTGLLFLTNFWVYQRSIVFNGLSLSVGVMRIAMIVPVVLALVLFRESLSAWNIAGIGLGIAAFGLKANLRELRNLLWIIGLFVISGLTDASLKLFKEFGSGGESVFIYIVFTSAFVFTLLTIIGMRISIPCKSILLGCGLGIPNRLSTVFFLKGLDSIPATLAYPIVAVCIVLLSIISDMVIWKKKATLRDVALWILLIISLVLLNI